VRHALDSAVASLMAARWPTTQMVAAIKADVTTAEQSLR
jgi:hypothetical protein